VTKRKCVWPGCLTEEQGRRLTGEIAYEDIHGVPQPGRDLTDWRAVHGCVDSETFEADPFANATR
jgi:hypothetical protein